MLARNEHRFDAVLFDLLTALLDSGTLWNNVAGSAEDGQRWRAAYLRRTYGTGAYRAYEELVAEAARIKLDMAYHSSQQLEKLVADLYATPPGLIETIKKLIPAEK